MSDSPRPGESPATIGAHPPLRVLFILPHPIEGPSSRFRVYQFLPYLEAHGVTCVVRPLVGSRLMPALYQDGGTGRKVAITLKALADRILDIGRALRCDLVYILREGFPFGPAVLEMLMAKAAGRMVFDFDDAIHLPSLAYTNPLDRLRDWRKPGRLIAAADATVAGSPYLAAFAANHAPVDRIHVLPTVVDPTVYRPAAKAARSTVTVGWIGTPRGSGYLQPLLPVLEETVRRHPATQFLFVGAEPFETGALPVEFRPWRLEREADDIREMDIGIMPLTDDEETRGKCGFKLIQYMSSGVPTVCSPVGANIHITRDGRTGFLASESSDWTQALCRLAADPTLRVRMGEHGRETVLAEFSLEVVAPRLVALIRSAARPIR